MERARGHMRRVLQSAGFRRVSPCPGGFPRTSAEKRRDTPYLGRKTPGYGAARVPRISV